MQLKSMTKKELYELAKTHNVRNRSKMTKAEIIKALLPILMPVESQTTESAVSSFQGGPEPVQASIQQVKKTEKYPIPDTYNRDLLTLMPVNPSTEYVCWELSRGTHSKYCNELNLDAADLLLKLYKKDADGSQVVETLQVGTAGSYSFHHYLPAMICWVEVGLKSDDGQYFPIMVSRRVKMPDDKVSDTGEVRSMTVKKNSQGLLTLSGYGEMDLDKPNDETWKGLSSYEFGRGL